MPTVWIEKSVMQGGGKIKHRVKFTLGGRDSRPQHGGQFERRRDAEARKRWVAGELAAMRVPDFALLAEQPTVPTLGAAADEWRASRTDVEDQTQNMHRSAFARIWKVCPHLRGRRIDKLTHEDVAELVAKLHQAGYRRESIKKSRTALKQTLTFKGIDPNPADDKRVKLPREKKAHIPPPEAEHVERIAETLPRHHVLPFLIIDACGPRVNELTSAQVGDLDEHRRGIRIRPENEKNQRYRLLELPDDLFDALLATLPPREDRNPEAPLFPELTDAALRVAIGKCCKATGTPHFSPHGLRRRRGSLHYKRTGSLADVAELLGDSKRVAAAHYVYSLTVYREADRSIALARAAE